MITPNIKLAGEFSQFEVLLLDRFPAKRHIRKDEVVYGLSDDRSRKCFYVLSGEIGCHYLDEVGNVRTSTIRGKGTIFPLYYTYASTSIERTLEFVATEDTVLLEIPKPELVRLMAEIPAISLAMMDAWGEYATYVIYSVESQFDSLKKRVCSFLLLHSDSYGVMHTTHSQIAQAVGTTRENVTRVLSELQKENVIETRRGVITLENKDRLREYASYIANIEE